VQHEPTGFGILVIQDVNPLGVQLRRPTLDAMDDVPLPDEKLSEVRTILTGHTGNKRALGCRCGRIHCFFVKDTFKFFTQNVDIYLYRHFRIVST
jgi:hypothetical protein